jgi:hypothetical protein
MRAHSGERPFACDMCDQRYAEYNHLARHRRSHMVRIHMRCCKCGCGTCTCMVISIIYPRLMPSFVSSSVHMCVTGGRVLTIRASIPATSVTVHFLKPKIWWSTSARTRGKNRFIAKPAAKDSSVSTYLWPIDAPTLRRRLRRLPDDPDGARHFDIVKMKCQKLTHECNNMNTSIMCMNMNMESGSDNARDRVFEFEVKIKR